MPTTYTISDILNLLTPWIIFGGILFVLSKISYWVKQHLFGLGLAATGRQNFARIAYIVFMLPGIILREGGRWVMAGMLQQKPEFITPIPRIDADGIVNTRVFHYLLLNPVFIALVAIVPFILGLAVVSFISYQVLNLPELLRLLSTSDPEAIRAALVTLLTRIDLPVWFYLIFSIANTTLPSAQELRSTWFIWVIAVGFLVFLAAIGLWNAIILIFAQPVSQLLYTLSAIFGVVVVVDAIAAAFIFIGEWVVGRFTNRRVQYRPPKPTPKKQVHIGAPRNVYDIRLPTPPPPSKLLPPSGAAKLGMGKVAETGTAPRVTGGTITQPPARPTVGKTGTFVAAAKPAALMPPKPKPDQPEIDEEVKYLPADET